MSTLAGSTSRTKARRKAFEIVFEAQQRGLEIASLVGQRPLPEYSKQLLQGVAANHEAIGEWLDTYSERWPTDKMASVDKAALFLGTYEVVLEDDVPDQVIIKDMADLVGELSTDKSPDFVSGILGRMAGIKDSLR